jgi:hypothetical protein
MGHVDRLNFSCFTCFDFPGFMITAGLLVVWALRDIHRKDLTGVGSLYPPSSTPPPLPNIYNTHPPPFFFLYIYIYPTGMGLWV